MFSAGASSSNKQLIFYFFLLKIQLNAVSLTLPSYLDQLRDGEPDKIPEADCTGLQDESRTYNLNAFLQAGYQELRNIIIWSKFVPGFGELDLEDKVCLLRASWMDLIVLRLSYRSLGHPKGITVFGKTLCLPHEEVLKMGWSQNMMEDHDEFTEKLRLVSPDRNEFACLCALVLLTCG